MSNLDRKLIYVHKYHPNDQEQPINQTGKLPPKTTHVLVSASGWRALQNVIAATGTKEKFKEAQVLVLPILDETIIDADKLMVVEEKKGETAYSYRYRNQQRVTKVFNQIQYALSQLSDNAFFEFDTHMKKAKKKTSQELEDKLSTLRAEAKQTMADKMANGMANAWTNRKV